MQQHEHGEVDDGVGERVHQGADAAHKALHAGKRGVLFAEGRRLFLLPGKGTQHARAGERFPRFAKHAIELRLHPAVLRDGPEHHAEHDERKQRDDREEHERGLRIDRKGHGHRAEHDERRAQQEPERQIHARLHLVDVARHPGDDGGGAERVQLREGKALHLFKQRVAQPPGKAHGGLCGKILCGDGGGKPHEAEQQQHAAHAEDIAAVRARYACVDDGGHHERHEELERGLKQLEQRPEHALFPIPFHVGQQFLHCSIVLQFPKRVFFLHILPSARGGAQGANVSLRPRRVCGEDSPRRRIHARRRVQGPKMQQNIIHGIGVCGK